MLEAVARSSWPPVPLLCYICHPDGTKSAASPTTRTVACSPVLPAVRSRSNGSIDVWRLRGGHLPDLRLGAGIFRRTRNRITDGFSRSRTGSESQLLGRKAGPGTRAFAARLGFA